MTCCVLETARKVRTIFQDLFLLQKEASENSPNIYSANNNSLFILLYLYAYFNNNRLFHYIYSCKSNINMKISVKVIRSSYDLEMSLKDNICEVQESSNIETSL